MPFTHCVSWFQDMANQQNLYRIVVRDRETGDEHLCLVRCSSSWAAVVNCLGVADRETALVSVASVREADAEAADCT